MPFAIIVQLSFLTEVEVLVLVLILASIGGCRLLLPILVS
jgi:hypothetical protein